MARFLFVSDTQSPLWFETLRSKADGNEAATERILIAMSHDAPAVAAFHLGDFTALGSFSSYWRRFDEQAAPLGKAGIPLYPAFGNHDYMPFGSRGRRNLVARFPFMGPPWYVTRVDSIAVVILNSNFAHLSGVETEAQQRWYEESLDTLDRDTSVTLIMVACHHPPYTNSKVIDPSAEVQKVFVPPFIQSHKARVFLSGHTHAFEHFHVSGKDFLVMGGGGGLLHTLRQRKAQRQRDQYPHDSARGFFHYLRCTSVRDALAMSVVRLSADKSSFDVTYTLSVALTSR